MQSEVDTSNRTQSEASENTEQHSATSRISIWFFIGGLVLVYGLLILAAGIHDLLAPPAKQTVLAGLHAGIWWGSLLGVLGGIYSYRFFPRKER